ncbi:RNA polymerase sigma factor [Curtobacterium sp. RRHDQ10]|uniref:RNA polymerase sigma factor n=1 Tax=Curtobacterium phyllosphaerae TaxID=3413379 RepID=UPI003BEFBB09
MPSQLHRIPLADADDATLAERAADGDVRAFEVLIRRFTPLLRAVARRTLGSGDEVDDVVQDTFITAWERLDSLSEPAKVKAWLSRIASHRSIDHVRARRLHDDVHELDPAGDDRTTPDRIVEARSREHAADLALRGLPDDQRRCWLLKEVLELSYDDIAEELGVPVSTVRGLLSRARKNMSTRMEGWR